MNFNTSSLFDKQSKRLAKKFNLLKNDLEGFINNFDDYHSTATNISNNTFKVRLSNSNKNRGKSAGYRIYYYIKLEESIYLLTIYDKSQIQSINEEILTELINEFI